MNEVQFAYNDFGQRESDYQSHGGAVDTGTTPKVAYTYANGSGNHIRRTKITYPNGRFLHIGYNSGDDGNLGRVSFLADAIGLYCLWVWRGRRALPPEAPAAEPGGVPADSSPVSSGTAGCSK